MYRSRNLISSSLLPSIVKTQVTSFLVQHTLFSLILSSIFHPIAVTAHQTYTALTDTRTILGFSSYLFHRSRLAFGLLMILFQQICMVSLIETFLAKLAQHAYRLTFQFSRLPMHVEVVEYPDDYSTPIEHSSTMYLVVYPWEPVGIILWTAFNFWSSSSKVLGVVKL